MNIKEYLKEQAEKCDKILFGFFDGLKDKDTKLFDAINYAVRSGGKRLRMIMMLEAYALFGPHAAQPLHAFAAALEMIHTYSLIHDDLPAMDNSDIRRGKPSVHKQFDECLAILAGDGLLSYAFEIMTREALNKSEKMLMDKMGGAISAEDARGFVAPVRALNIIAGKSGLFGMVYGQALDTENPGVTCADLKYSIDRNKTAAMFEAAVCAGAVLGGAPQAAVKNIEAFGHHFGMAFQILDDIADGDAPPEKREEALRNISIAKNHIAKYDKNRFFESLCEYILTPAF